MPSIETINIFLNNINYDLGHCFFIGFNEIEYNSFIQYTKLNIDFYKCTDLYEMLVILNSCKIAYLGLSAPATLANGLHKNHYLMSCNIQIDNNLNNYKHIIKHVNDIF